MTELNRIYAAHATGRRSFCVSATDGDPDDPFTAILLYDASFAQPWRRIDVKCIIVSIATKYDPNSSTPYYIALSQYGDVYHIRDKIDQERVYGPAVDPDLPRDGLMNCVTTIEERLYAGGSDSQTFHRPSTGWRSLGAGGLSPEPGFTDISIGSIAGTSSTDVYFAASINPTSDSRALTDDEWGEMDRLIDLGDQAGARAISRRAEGSQRSVEGRIYHWNGVSWNRLAVPVQNIFRDIYVDFENVVWCCGTNGAIIKGNERSGFQTMHLTPEKNHFVSMTRFGPDYICASDYELHRFDGVRLTNMKPMLKKSIIPTPLKVQAIDSVLYYFDYKHGIYAFDGSSWDEITIPSKLLDRAFLGLK